MIKAAIIFIIGILVGCILRVLNLDTTATIVLCFIGYQIGDIIYETIKEKKAK